MRLTGRVIAVLATLGMIVVLVVNQWVKPADPSATGAWLFEGASRTMVIACTLFTLAWYAGWGLFIAYQRVMDTHYPDRHYRRAAQECERVTSPAAPQIARPAGPPTAPLPVAPTEQPTVTVTE